MKILFVTPFLPTPLRRPLHDRIVALANNGHQIHLVSLWHSEEEALRFKSSAAFVGCASINLTHHSRAQALFNCARYSLSAVPLREAYFYSPSMQRQLRQIANDTDFDVLHASYLRGGYLALSARHLPVPKVLDLIDCTTAYVKSQLSNVRNPSVLPLLVSERLRIERYERKIASQFDAVLVVSKRDYDELSRVLGKPDRYVLTDWFFSTDLSYAPPQDTKREADRIVFVGGMAYKPNSDGIRWFLDHVWPMITSRVPHIHLDIVGADPPEGVQKRAGEQIRVTGWVDDVRPYVSCATVSVCPIQTGAGAQQKVLEAMAVGTPVVSTSFGSEGVEARDGVDILVADDPEQFANRVLELLIDKTLWQKLSKNGQRFVAEKYSLSAATQRLEQIYAQLLAQRRPVCP